MSTHRNSRLAGAAAALVSTTLRIALTLAGFVLALGALLVGLVLSIGLMVWAVSRGRRPVGRIFGAHGHGMRGGFSPGAATSGRASRGEVIDVAVREVPTVESRRD